MKLKTVFQNSYLEVIDQHDSHSNLFCLVITRKELNICDELFIYVYDYYGYDFWSPMRNDNET